MKKSNYVIFSLFAFLLFSCVQGAEKRTHDEGAGDVESSVNGAGSVLQSPNGKEDFEQFIQKFSTQETFQLQRIKFPIKVVIPDEEHEGMAPMEETIGKYEWEMLDLTYDSTYLARPYDQYYQDVRYKNDTAVVEIRGINNGIYADYYFTLIEDKWYLVTLYEASF